MTVVLIGHGDIKEFELLSNAIETRGGEVIVVNLADWPGGTPLSYAPGEDVGAFGVEFEYEDVTGAYALPVPFFSPFDLRFGDRLTENPRPTLNQLREYRAVFESLCQRFEATGANVLPSVGDYHWHNRKPWQLTLYENRDIPVPDTLFTTDPERVKAFHDENDDVIYKPVTSGGYPRKLTERDLTEDRLSKLATAPVQFQEFVPGDDLRIYFLDGEIVGSARYLSDSFSFKMEMEEGEDVEMESVSLSEAEKETVRKAADVADLSFGAADVIRRPDGGHALLEVNEAPRWSSPDIRVEQDIAGRLAEYLLNA